MYNFYSAVLAPNSFASGRFPLAVTGVRTDYNTLEALNTTFSDDGNFIKREDIVNSVHPMKFSWMSFTEFNESWQS